VLFHAFVAEPATDETVERLARLFLEHPAWVAAARHLSRSATSTVYFSHRAGEPFRLDQSDGQTRLLPGAAPDPDFVFRFTPVSVDILEEVEGGIGDFAVSLFGLILKDDPAQRVGFRIAADFLRLARRGYVRLLLAAGPRVIAFGASHGIYHLGALRRFVADLRAREPEEWES
jgi:hypothetical protein